MKRNHKILTAIGAVGALCAATFIRMDAPSAAYPFPCNANTTMAVYVPSASTHGTLMFEDQWPGYGDLDFNDAVISYQYSLAYNTAGNLVQLVGTFNVLAAGSGHDNGFGLQLPIPKANVSSVTLQLGNGAPSALVPRAAESNLVVDVLPSIKAAFSLANDGHQINTDPSAAVLPGATYRLVVTLSTPTALSSAAAPFDAFIYWSGAPSHEIHRPGYAGTSSMNAALFGTLQDGSSGARHFVDNRGIPNALDVPQSIKWSKETVDISGGYSQLAAFGASGGVSNQTWYQSPTNASLFTSGQGGAQPPGASFIGGADASFTVDGTCNLCVANNVSCPAAPDQCHDQGTCAPATGVCSAAPAKANGTSCDDGNSGTVNDICTNGTCAGTPSSGPCTPGSLSVGAAVNLAGSFAAAPSNFHPQGMGLAADGTSFSVVLQSTQQIRLMNPQTGALVSSTGISNGLNHTTGIAWDPGNSRYFVADYTSNNSGIDLWSVTSGGSASQASNEVSAYGGYPLAVGNGRLYRGSIISNTYDWTNLTQIRVSNVGTPDSIITTLSPGIGGIEDMAWDGAALWVLGYTPDANTDTPINLYRVDPTSGAVLGSYPNVATSGANRRASGLEYLNGTLYVFNWSSGGTSTLLPISTGCGALPAGCALASDNTVWCATQTVNQTGSQICGYPDGYAGTYYPITAAGAAALGRTIVGYGDCATNYYSGAQIQGSSMSCWTDAQRWARNGTSTNGQATGGNVVRCTNLENGAFSAAYATVHVDSGSKDIALVYAPSGTSFSSNADYKAYCESKGFKQNQNSNSAAPYQTAGMYDASSYYCNQHCCFLGSGNSVWANSASNFVNHGLPTSTPLQVFDRGCAQWCSGSFVNDLNTSDTITVNGANSASYNVNAIGGGSNYCAAKSNAFSQNGVVVCEMP